MERTAQFRTVTRNKTAGQGPVKARGSTVVEPCRWITVLLLVTAGCTVNQEKEVAVYREVLSGPGAVRPAALEPNQPLTLPAAMELADWNNEQLSIRGEDYLQALIDKDRAAQAGHRRRAG